MFDKEYRFKGRHAIRMGKLTARFDEESKASVFDRNIDVFINAPLVGFLYNRKADLDDTRNPQSNEIESQHIMGDRVLGSRDELLFSYRLIMLLDKGYEPSLNKRVDKAFRTNEPTQEDENLFYSYTRGGIDVLYEKIIEDANKPDDYIKNLSSFIKDFNDRFNESINKEELIQTYSKWNERSIRSFRFFIDFV